MALQFIEGFDRVGHRDDLVGKWDDIDLGSTGSFPAGRFGGQCWSSSSGRTLTAPCTNPGTTNSIIVGFALKPPTNVNASIISFRDGGSEMCSLHIETDGTLVVATSSAHQFQTTKKLTVGVWHYVEVKILFHQTTGEASISIDGKTPESSASNLDTLAGSTTECDGIQFKWVSGSTYWDDIYIADTSGSDLNDFIGDSVVEHLVPNADNTVQFTRSAGSNNFENVDEATPDGDTTYNQSNTTTHEDEFDFATFGIGGSDTIHGVNVNVTAVKVDVGAADLKCFALSSATYRNSADLGLGTGTYKSGFLLSELDPDGDTAWDNTALDAATFGYRRN